MRAGRVHGMHVQEHASGRLHAHPRRFDAERALMHDQARQGILVAPPPRCKNPLLLVCQARATKRKALGV